MTTFVALDFETATWSPSTACEIGLVRVEAGKVVTQKAFLIQPPSREFVFSYLHGITWNKVKRAPIFSELLPRLLPILEGAEFVAAHYAPFDRRVLYATCNHYRIEAPPYPFVCTVRVARAVWNIRPTTLPDVCSALGIALKHHHRASYDALACAGIVQCALKELSPEQFEALFLVSARAGLGRRARRSSPTADMLEDRTLLPRHRCNTTA